MQTYRKDKLNNNIELISPSDSVTFKEGQEAEDEARYRANLMDSMAASTVRAYGSRWQMFLNWCGSVMRTALPCEPGTVAAYVDYLERQGRRPSTVMQSLAAISRVHGMYGIASPCRAEEVRTAVKAMKRRVGVAPYQKAAATIDVIRAIVGSIGHDKLRDLRDRALILVGFAGAFRRSELAALTLGDLQWSHDASGRGTVVVTVRRSKTDPLGEGMEKVLFAARQGNEDLCPLAALRQWLDDSWLIGRHTPLFPAINRGGQIMSHALTGQSAAQILQARAKAAGVELDLGGHSLRRGFVTSAIAAGASERSIMHQTGHKSSLVLRRYFERHDVMQDNAAAEVL